MGNSSAKASASSLESSASSLETSAAKQDSEARSLDLLREQHLREQQHLLEDSLTRLLKEEQCFLDFATKVTEPILKIQQNARSPHLMKNDVAELIDEVRRHIIDEKERMVNEKERIDKEKDIIEREIVEKELQRTLNK